MSLIVRVVIDRVVDETEVHAVEPVEEHDAEDIFPSLTEGKPRVTHAREAARRCRA